MAPWFHGAISKELSMASFQAVRYQPGSFMIRFSERFPENFTVMYIPPDAPARAESVRSVLIANYGSAEGYNVTDGPRDGRVYVTIAGDHCILNLLRFLEDRFSIRIKPNRMTSI
jgi:hypothetical protein